MFENDDPYHHLFAHPRMVADLLRGFVREPWIERLDLMTLEPRSEPRLLGRPEPPGAGSAWRVRWLGGRSHAYVLLALPRAVDRLLALKLRLRAALLHDDLARRGELPRSRRLPWIVPIAVYHGEELWSAPRDVADLLDPLPRGMERYEQRGRYLLLDALREPIPEPAQEGNLVAGLFELERSRNAASLARAARRIADLLPEPEGDEMRRSFLEIALSMLPPGGAPAFLDLGEVGPPEPARRWREEGRRQGRIDLLAELLERRFGPLGPADRERLGGADAERLLAWGERLATAGSLGEVFQ